MFVELESATGGYYPSEDSVCTRKIWASGLVHRGGGGGGDPESTKDSPEFIQLVPTKPLGLRNPTQPSTKQNPLTGMHPTDSQKCFPERNRLVLPASPAPNGVIMKREHF